MPGYDELKPLMERINEQMYERIALDGDSITRSIGPMRGNDDTFICVAT